MIEALLFASIAFIVLLAYLNRRAGAPRRDSRRRNRP